MDITAIRVKLGDEYDIGKGCLAYVSVTFDNCFVVHGMKVVQTASRTFVSMPECRILSTCPVCLRKRRPVGNPCGGCGNVVPHLNNRGVPRRWKDVAHPITKEFRDILETRILRAYEDARRSTEPSDARALVVQ